MAFGALARASGRAKQAILARIPFTTARRMAKAERQRRRTIQTALMLRRELRQSGRIESPQGLAVLRRIARQRRGMRRKKQIRMSAHGLPVYTMRDVFTRPVSRTKQLQHLIETYGPSVARRVAIEAQRFRRHARKIAKDIAENARG